MAFLRFEAVSKAFPQADGGVVSALKNVSFSIAPGELIAMIGPSGCGKTTALRLIAGLETPDSGTLELDQKPLVGVPPEARDVAMVFQSPALFPHLTVEGNLSLGLKLRKFDSATVRDRVGQAAVTLGLQDKLRRFPHELSGGEAQRVALGRALVRQPKVFLLDEPLTSLDPITRKQLRREIVCLQEQLNTTMIYVTHEPREALALGHRVIVLEGGELKQFGTPGDLRHAPATPFVAEFLEDLF